MLGWHENNSSGAGCIPLLLLMKFSGVRKYVQQTSFALNVAYTSSRHDTQASENLLDLINPPIENNPKCCDIVLTLLNKQTESVLPYRRLR